MPHSPGEQLGPYEILSAIGAGGMGEVYKARDTRLDRTVAIKVLPEHIAQREDLRARFEREARAVASLNHPHICTLFDIGPGYMVMELIEGETLAARIEKGALPLDQALKFAAQIADALDRAHRAGVTHRDVKPQNIMLTRDGVKVLDFGLAKSSSSKPAPTESTLTAALTAEGTVMGTPQYMAPEQFEGKEADARSDIWAFGAVLYEMVTGQKAFQGKSCSSLVGAILSADPVAMSVKPFTPAWLERLVRRCLAKDPEDRWQTMRDIVIELRSPPAETAAKEPANVSRVPWAVAGAFALAFLAAATVWRPAPRPAPLRPLIRVSAEIGADAPLTRVAPFGYTGANSLAISPDGTRLAVTLRDADGEVRIYTRLLHQSQAMPLAGTENAYSPFFSPAGDWIGFFAGGKLKKVPVAGGAPLTLCDALSGYGGSWGDDDTIVAAFNRSGPLWRIPSAGGVPVPLTKLNPGEVTHRWPQVLPGSKTVLFTAANQTFQGYDNAAIDAVSVQTGERTRIASEGFFARYLAGSTGSSETGHLLYLREDTLFAARFDPGRLVPIVKAAPVLEGVSSTLVAGGDYALAQDGTFVYLAANALQTRWPISWVDSRGKTEPLLAPAGRFLNPRLSPDGKRLAFSANNSMGADIWMKDLDRDTPARLTSLPGMNSFPVWTPDGKHIVFLSGYAAAPGLYCVRSDGSGEAKRLSGWSSEQPSSFSPDGKRLATHQVGISGSYDISTIPVEEEAGGITIRPDRRALFLGTSFDERNPAFSPDGRWIAYSSNESERLEVYVRPVPGPGGRTLVSAGGGHFPVWSRNGGELLFEAPDQRIMAVTHTARGGSFAAGQPRLWAETRLRVTSNVPNYDLTPDGKRLAAIVAAGQGAEKPPTHLTLLLNFSDELRRKAPEGK